MRLVRRMPKRGFYSPHRVEYSVVNLEALEAFDAGTMVNPQALEAKGLKNEAMLAFRRALEINPRYEIARKCFWKR